ASPDFAQDFAANAFTPRLPSGHHAARSGHDADAQPALHALDLVAAHIHAAARTRYTRQVADRRFVVRAVLQVNAQHVVAVLFGGLVVGNVAFFLQNARNLGLQLRRRNVQLLVTRPDRIANPRQEICYRIGQTHRFSFIPRSLASARTSGNVLSVKPFTRTLSRTTTLGAPSLTGRAAHGKGGMNGPYQELFT